MKIFRCQNCANSLYFSNDTCLNCNHRVGYLPALFDMTALEPEGDAWHALAQPQKSYFFCQNAEEAACNWLVEAGTNETFCLACRYNRTIPDLAIEKNHENWRKIEQAKKHLFYSLTRFGLPIPDRIDNAQTGLEFEFLADVIGADGQVEPVMTGHANGLISINIAEADDAERERRRATMGEPYRTLIGHFRHEIGHFYWDLLVRDQERLEAFSTVFGDPGSDYDAALAAHYQNGPPADWQQNYISAYASSHPWEDFAETWAHCLHMIDGLETARAFGIAIKGFSDGPVETETMADPYRTLKTEQIIAAWIPLTVAVNSLNRSLGQPDFYPFVLSPAVIGKIDFILQLIGQART